MGFQVWNLLGDPTFEKLDYEKPLQVLFTRDGERLLIVRPDENNNQRYALDLWDISEGLQQATFFHSIEKLGVPRVAISSDQHRIAAVHDRSRNDFELRITNLADLTEELVFGSNYSFDDRNLGQITDLQFSPDGMSLLTLWRDGLVTHWDLSASRNVVHFDDRTSVTTIQEPYPMIVAAAMTDVPLDRLQIAADGDAIIGGGPTAELVIWRKSDDLRAVTPQVFAFQDGNARYRSIEECDVAPEAKQIAAIVDYNGAVLIDIPSGNPVYLSRDAFLVRFNQRGTKLHLSGSSTTLMYDLQAGRSFPLSRRPSATAQSFQERLTSGVSFENDSWGLIDPDSGAAVASLVPENIRSSGQWAISPDKTLFAALARGRNSDGYGIEVFDIKSAKRTVYMPINLDSWNRLRFSPDGSKLLISTSDSVLTVDYRRRKIVDTIWPYGKGSTETPERSIAGSSAGGAAKVAAASQVACGSWRGGPVSCMDVTATGMLAVGAKGGDVTLLSLDSKRNPYTHKLPGREVNDVRFSDNGKLLTCQTEYDLFLVDVSEFAVLDAEAERHDGAQDEEPRDTFAERQAAKVKVAKSLSALLDDDNEFVRQLAQELLRRLDSAASQAGDSSSESQ